MAGGWAYAKEQGRQSVARDLFAQREREDAAANLRRMKAETEAREAERQRRAE